MSNADELMVSEKTAHNYLNAGLFDADKMDCPRIIRMRPRRSTPKLKIDRHCYEAVSYTHLVRKALIGPRLVPFEDFAVQCQFCVTQGEGIHLRRISLLLGQQEPVRFFLNDPEALPDRFRLFGPDRRLVLRPAGIAGAVCPPAAR